MTLPKQDIPGTVALLVLMASALALMVTAVVNCFRQVCDKGAERDRPDGYRGEPLDD